MLWLRLAAVALIFATLSGCLPGEPAIGGPGTPGFSQERYERHKADRAKYQYQGF